MKLLQRSKTLLQNLDTFVEFEGDLDSNDMAGELNLIPVQASGNRTAP